MTFYFNWLILILLGVNISLNLSLASSKVQIFNKEADNYLICYAVAEFTFVGSFKYFS